MIDVLKCPRGPQVFRQPVADPVYCSCGAVHCAADLLPATREKRSNESLTVRRCVLRGELIAKLSEEIGCGCRGVLVYRCNKTGELVTLRPIEDRGRQTLSIEWTEYHGKDCQHCRQHEGA